MNPLVQSKNGLWCKSRVYCCHISHYLVKTTLRILGQQIRGKKYEFLLCGRASKQIYGSFFPFSKRGAGVLQHWTHWTGLRLGSGGRGHLIHTVSVWSSQRQHVPKPACVWLRVWPGARRTQTAMQPVRPEPHVHRQLLPSEAGTHRPAAGQTLPDVSLDESIR